RKFICGRVCDPGHSWPKVTIAAATDLANVSNTTLSNLRARHSRAGELESLNQKRISNSLMPFHFPGWFGSNDVLSTQVPYRAGAHGLSICSGLRPSLNPRGTTPVTSGRFKRGGGVSIARTGFCGPIGALNSCAEAVVTSAARTAMMNVFIFFLSFQTCKFLPTPRPCPHYIIRLTTLQR